jgi:CDP-paratose 2-epimerase
MSRTIFITGGAGFVGINSAKRFLEDGFEVVIYDNFSRKGGEQNVEWLRCAHPKNFRVVKGCMTDFELLKKEVVDVDAVLHLAAQVAVTSSVQDPRWDFQVNALGAFNLLEAVRTSKKNPVTMYSSTNKVYGALEGKGLGEGKDRFAFSDAPNGVAESEPLDFHSPYGCSKGSADQYFRDYSRIFGLRTVVFRQSCIYGLRQFGNEDQGWVAHFIISAILGRPLTIYGNGKQVRDLLYANDLSDLYARCVENPEKVSGRIYNIGGGMANSVSLLELIRLLESMLGKKLEPKYGPWRPGDQRIYVSDVAAIGRDLGWKPTTTPEAGVGKLAEWVKANPGLFE